MIEGERLGRCVKDRRWEVWNAEVGMRKAERGRWK
jgi:hypothetical protein